MFVFGHLGFGTTLTRPWYDQWPRWALFAGMLLPDAIDKPLYYSHLFSFVTCTRTFGHTGLLIAAILLAGMATGHRVMLALAAGMATHVLLDCLFDVAVGDGASSAWRAVTWPLLNSTFTTIDRMSIASHFLRLVSVQVIASDLVGAVLLWWNVRPKRSA